MGEIEVGACDICGQSSKLGRKYYYYDIKCECHSPEHFEIVRYCSNCKPKPPEKTTVSIQPKYRLDMTKITKEEALKYI